MSTITTFIKKRIIRDTFYGLPLTCLVILFGVLLVTFLGITEDVITSDPIVQLDDIIANLFSYNRNMYTLQFFLFVTMWGKATITIPIIMLFSLYVFLRKKSTYIAPLIITTLGSSLTVTLVKHLVHRARPGDDIAYYLERSLSFPSGHAAVSIALYGFIAYYCFSEILGRRKVAGVIMIFTVVIALIGFSRVYLGVHYVSDVLGGYILGTLWLILGITVTESLTHRLTIKSKKDFTNHR